MKHFCDEYDLQLVKRIHEMESQSIGIYRCRTCGQFWKIRWQFDGAGRDDIWLQPGESKRGYTFTFEELENLENEKVRKWTGKKPKG